jgi:hypothetical protein
MDGFAARVGVARIRVASGLAVANALANADCVYFYERALLEKGRDDNGEPRLAR